MQGETKERWLELCIQAVFEQAKARRGGAGSGS
jgi:hypothetical protein